MHHEASINANFSNLENDTVAFRMSRTSPGRYAHTRILYFPSVEGSLAYALVTTDVRDLDTFFVLVDHADDLARGKLATFPNPKKLKLLHFPVFKCSEFWGSLHLPFSLIW